MNEVKITEDRLMDLLVVERYFKELTSHLYQNREVATAYAGSDAVHQSVSYKIDSAVIDEVLINNMKGFKEEIEDEKKKVNRQSSTDE